jgi:hypothetical protein
MAFKGHTSRIASQSCFAIGHLQKVWYVSSRSNPQITQMSVTSRFRFFLFSHVARELVDSRHAKTRTLGGGGRAPPHRVPDGTIAVRCPARCTRRSAMKVVPCKLVRASNREDSPVIRSPGQHIILSPWGCLELRHFLHVHLKKVLAQQVRVPFTLLRQQLHHSSESAISLPGYGPV